MNQSPELVELGVELVATCRQLEETGYVVGTYGNVSVRMSGGLLITPTRIDFNVLTPDDLVEVGDDGSLRSDSQLPSSELDVHRKIYEKRPDIQAVIHTHSIFATALSCLHRVIPVLVEEHSQVLGAEIRTTQYIPASHHAALGVAAAEALGDANAVLLANHGPVCCGRSLREATFATTVTERMAQMYFLTTSIGGAVEIRPDFVDLERDRFLYRYGSASDRTEQAHDE